MPPKKASSSGAKKATGAKKAPSAYNKYMKDVLPEIKKKHPSMSHQDAFKEAAKQWKNHPSNPKRVK